MAIPVHDNSGAAASGTSQTLSVPYPTGISANDFLVLYYGGSDDTIPTVPSAEWAVMRSNTRLTNASVVLYRKIADGTESGNLSFDTENTVAHIARMALFTGATDYEGDASWQEAAKTVTHGDLTTSGPDRLALIVTSIDDNETASSFTGETGGDLTLLHNDETTEGSNHGLSLQTAGMASAGTLSSGTWTYSGATENYCSDGCAIFAAAKSLPQTDPYRFQPLLVR